MLGGERAIKRRGRGEEEDRFHHVMRANLTVSAEGKRHAETKDHLTGFDNDTLARSTHPAPWGHHGPGDITVAMDFAFIYAAVLGSGKVSVWH